MFVTPLILTTLSFASPTTPANTAKHIALDPPSIKVGDKVVKGKTLKPFDNEWTRPAGGAHIRETLRAETVDGRKCLIRDQYFPMGNPGMEMYTELTLDAKTLETIRIKKEIIGLPEGADLGDHPLLVRWDFDGTSYTRALHTKGEPVISEGKFDAPMFNGGGLGLVIAALPLKQDYEALLPVAMLLGMPNDMTFYTVHLRVVGKQPFPRAKGKDVDYWVVAVDWIDPESGEITSAGGADLPGGAYFVSARPPKGFPHVARYANDTTLIDLVTE